MRRARIWSCGLALAVLVGCGGDDDDDDGAGPPASDTPSAATATVPPSSTREATATRTPAASPTAPQPTPTASDTPTATPTEAVGRCRDFDPRRNVYFGDLHVHTAYSFDAWVFDVRADPRDAYRFARGEALAVSPLDAEGRGTQIVQLARPLDFAAVTDHSEFLGEVDICLVPGAAGFDSAACETFRAGGNVGQLALGLITTAEDPMRSAEVCDPDDATCLARAAVVWQRTIEAAEEANDSGPDCSFTSFVAYEYTANTGASSRHRNVIFRTADVPFPVSYIEQPTPQGLWAALRSSCLEGERDCDVLAIPHNSNQSNGNMFLPVYPDAASPAEERAAARSRSAIEPLVEIFQHKGDSECSNGLGGILGEADELCGFEKLRTPPFEDCGDGTGSGGTANAGCVSRRDFVRGALLAGLEEEERIGANPFRLGIVASTDTHNGLPGSVDEDAWVGHRGDNDDTPDKRLVRGGFRNGVVFNPGGLAAVWAEENTRDSLFAALARREVFGTSGPRIAVRFFGGWDLPAGLCDDPELVRHADESGVPMGAVLPGIPEGTVSPTFVVTALRDPGGGGRPPIQLQRIQIIKGWIADGQARQRVFDVAGAAAGGASVDPATCQPSGPGFDSLCTVWTDPDFHRDERAFYYVRVLENPSCRWTAYQCNALDAGARPEVCDGPTLERTVQERAWTSPIWFEPVTGHR